MQRSLWIPDEHWDAANRILQDAGIPTSESGARYLDEADAHLLEYRRMYTSHAIRLTRAPSGMIEHEVRKAADAWREGLGKLFAETLV